MMLGIGAGNALACEDVDAQRQLIGSRSPKLLSTLMRLLKSQRHKPSRISEDGEVVEPELFWRVRRLGDMAVFNEEVRSEGTSVAVQILLDRSGSMQKIMHEAANCAMAMADALRRVSHCQSALAVFPGVSHSSQMLLNWTERVQVARKGLARLSADGGTPLAEAVNAVLPGLMSRRVDRRILFVITDGQPSQRNIAMLALDKARAMGCEVMGVGIGTDISSLIHKSVQVSGVDDLSVAIETLMGKKRDRLTLT